MNIRFFVLLFIACILMALKSSDNDVENTFYYGFDKKIPLLIKENKLIVKYTDEFDKEKVERFLREFSSTIKIKWHDTSIAELTTESEGLKKELKSVLDSRDEVYTCQPIYTLKDGLEIKITDELMVKFMPDVSVEQQMTLFKQYNTTVIKTTKIYQKLKIPKGANALEIANKFFETGLFRFAYPKFLSIFESLQVYPNDTYFNKQITCHNTGQSFLPDNHSGTSDADIDAPEAWTVTKGCSDILIAVIDEGVTSNHPDLPNTRQVRLAGSNFGDGDEDDPSPTGNMNHGNACAGVIAATMDNYQGIAGIAPYSRIMPIRIANDNGSIVDEDALVDAIEFAVDNGANILSNSWGAETSDQNASPAIVTAIDYAIDNDCIVVFAAGNGADQQNNYDCFVYFPANVDIDGVITVGASDRYDHQANYSPTDDLLDVVAPSNRSMPWLSISGETYEMWSIDIPDSAGYNLWPAENYHPPSTGETMPSSGTNYLAYTSRFGGTSHSCPVVAGIAALILSLNPELNSVEVLDILTSTANKVGGFTYTNGRCDEMGYGRVNAYQAVLAAREGGSISGNFVVCQSPNVTFTYNDCPAGTTLYWTKSSNLEYVSGQNTNYYTVRAYSGVYGAGWVKATLNSACEGLKYSVWIGTFESTWVTGQVAVCPDSYYTYTAQVPGGHKPDYSYSWTYPSNWYNYDQYQNTISLVTPLYNPDGGAVRVSITNECGTSGYSGITVYPDYNCGGYFSIYPNPASEIITITNKISSELETKVEDLNKTYTVRILDIYSNLHFSGIRSGDTFTIPINNLTDGNYIVQISDGKKIYNLRLVIKH